MSLVTYAHVVGDNTRRRRASFCNKPTRAKMIGNMPEVCRKVIVVILKVSEDTVQATAVADLEAARCN